MGLLPLVYGWTTSPRRRLRHLHEKTQTTLTGSIFYKAFKEGNGTILSARKKSELLSLHPPEEAHFSCLYSMCSSLLTAVVGKGRNVDWLENWAVSPSSSERCSICIAAEAAPISQFISHSFSPPLVSKTLGYLIYFKRPSPKQPMSLSWATP